MLAGLGDAFMRTIKKMKSAGLWGKSACMDGWECVVVTRIRLIGNDIVGERVGR